MKINNHQELYPHSSSISNDDNKINEIIDDKVYSLNIIRPLTRRGRNINLNDNIQSCDYMRIFEHKSVFSSNDKTHNIKIDD